MQRRPHYAAPPRPYRDVTQDPVVETVPPPPSQPAGCTARSGAQKAAAKPAKRHVTAATAKPQAAGHGASSRAQEAAAKAAKRQPKAATAGLSSGSSAQPPAPARKENLTPHGHEATAAPTGWLPHPLLVRQLSGSRGLAASRLDSSQPADALPSEADASDTGGSSALGTLAIRTRAEAPSTVAGTSGTVCASSTGTVEPVGALATPPQLLPAEKDGWKAGQASRARGAVARQAAFEESPVLPALIGTATSVVASECGPAAVITHDNKVTHAEHISADQRVQHVPAAGGGIEGSGINSKSGRRVAADARTSGSLSERTAAWSEFAATQTRGPSSLDLKSYRSGTMARAMASRSSSASRRAVEEVSGAAEVGFQMQVSARDTACSATSAGGSTIDGTTAAGAHSIVSDGADGRSRVSSCDLSCSATPGQSSAGSVSIARGIQGSDSAGGLEFSDRGTDAVRVVNMAFAARSRVRQSVQVKPAVRVSYSPAAGARVVASRLARLQVRIEASPEQHTCTTIVDSQMQSHSCDMTLVLSKPAYQQQNFECKRNLVYNPSPHPTPAASPLTIVAWHNALNVYGIRPGHPEAGGSDDNNKCCGRTTTPSRQSSEAWAA